MSISDLDQISENPFSEKHYDVCIAGSGPAGLTLARKLSADFDVCVVEAGGMDFSRHSQNQYKGSNTGEKYFLLDHCRMRHFGGSSAVWGGACRLLDPEDFEKKPFVKYSGWPIGPDDLNPYIAETADILDVKMEPEPIEHTYTTDHGWPPAMKGMHETEFRVSQAPTNFGGATHFGRKYADEVRNNPRIDCYLNAAVVDIELSDDQSETIAFEVANNQNQRFKVTAKKFIIAAGGIENPRILLNANKQQKNGVGNNQDLVGRFFAEHPHQYLGEFILEDEALEKAKTDKSFNKYIDWTPHGRYFKPSRDTQYEKQELNYSMAIFPAQTKLSIQDNKGFKGKLREIVCSSETIHDTAEWIKDGSVSCIEWKDGYISSQSEQEPNPNSRITLTDTLDIYGNPMLNLHWEFTEKDKEVIKRAAYDTAKAFAESHTGRIRLEHWLHQDEIKIPGYGDGSSSIVAGPHHMCTTRMAESPEEGVVDKNQKVFGIDNLYMAGSSVFSSAGFSNPTFTIVQTSLRLADHLKETLKA